MKQLWPTRACVWLCRHTGQVAATWPRITIIICILLTALLSVKVVLTPQVSSIDGWSRDNARSRYEYQVFQEFLNADGQGITLVMLLRAQDNQSMIRMEYMTETIEILEFVSSHFPMYDADLGKNQSFDEFCRGFCQANEPVRMFYNGLRVVEGNVSDLLQQRINLSYPTSEIFSVKFSVLPNFFGVEMEEDGKIKSVSVVALTFRAERHPSWTTDMVKKWETNVEDYFASNYDQRRIDVNVASFSILERGIVKAGESLRPFLVIGFLIMCIFCTSTTLASSVIMYHHRATFKKVVLSVTACIVPFMACGTALGAIFLIGVTNSPILHVTPFLVLAISVDDSFLMVHAWNRIGKSNEKTQARPEMMGQVLAQTGPAIVISSLTNMLAFAVGAVSSPSEIHIFCVGNAACIFVDMCYQVTFYSAIMAIFADPPMDSSEKEEYPRLKHAAQSFVKWYTRLVADLRFSLTVVLVWIVFVAGAIVGSSYSTVDLTSHKVFLPDSKLLEIERIRNKFVIPAYTPATIVVSNPGNLSDSENVRGLLGMKDAFESLPHALGPESTKFLVSEFVNYKDALRDELGEDPSAGTLAAFLHWPEYSYYNGFIKRRNASDPEKVEQFMFVTGYRGAQLISWQEKRRLLYSLRREVDRFAKRFNISVYSEDGFVVDLLETIPVITWQTGLATFVCVIVVCALFINHLATILFVSMAILATCTGVFGYMSLFGTTLDPIVMSILIMCVGFSVDIPAHVSFHFHASRSQVIKRSNCSTINSNGGEVSVNEDGEESCFKSKLQHTLCSVGFPVIQAGLSTILCALPLAFVPLYMAQGFSTAMLLCISFSMIHGVVILPAMFCLYDRASIAIRKWISTSRRKKRCVPA